MLEPDKGESDPCCICSGLSIPQGGFPGSGPKEGLGKWLTLTVYERPVILFRSEEISGVDRRDLLQILNDPPRGEI